MPDVEHKILSYVGPRDLVNAKLVSKKWYQGVRRYLNHLKTSNKDEELRRLLRKSLLEPVTCFVTINLPRQKRDLCVNAGKELFILSDESVMELDIGNLHVAKELPFPRVYGDKWKGPGKKRPMELSARGDGHFAVKQKQCWAGFDQNGRPIRSFLQLQFKRTKSGNLLEYVGHNETATGFTRNSLDFFMPRGMGYYEMFGGAMAGSKIAIEMSKFCKEQINSSPYDVAWLGDGSAAVFSVNTWGVSRLYGIEAGGGTRLIATIPMVSANLHIVGTRVICHSNANNNSIIVFDVWNPESVRQEGAIVTKVRGELREGLLVTLSWTSSPR